MKFRYLLLIPFLQSCFLFDGPDPVVPPVVKEDLLPEFTQTPDVFPIQRGLIDEASGITASISMPGNIWVEQDGNTPSEIYLINNSGQYLGAFPIPFFNRDWEDIAMGPGPETGANYIYLAETGDNAENYEYYKVYRFKEPASLQEKNTLFETISFRYPDTKSYDTEAMLIDPATKDIYLITKRQFNVNVFRIAYPQSTTDLNTAEFLGAIPYTIITAADISPDGTEILLKNYDAVYFWRRKKDETIIQALSRTRDVGPPYQHEEQGEAICFDIHQKGFYTLSEIGQSNGVSLYYYGKKIID